MLTNHRSRTEVVGHVCLHSVKKGIDGVKWAEQVVKARTSREGAQGASTPQDPLDVR